MLDKIKNIDGEVKIALVGKYTSLKIPIFPLMRPYHAGYQFRKC